MNQNSSAIGRRDLIKLVSVGALGLASRPLWKAQPAQAVMLPSPNAALKQLMAGNQRFAQHKPTYPDQTVERLQEVAQSQSPFATVLTCADSRVPVEILFDQGIGDIFDVRVAGNIATPEVIGSIEYAVELLGTPLLMVLGHERCGAVTAAVKYEPLPGDIGTFVDAILPAVERVKDQPGDTVDKAVAANVVYQIEKLQRSPLIKMRSQAGKLKIVGGRYDLDSGQVKLIA
ncbi:Carbonic anhydrase 2 [Acaryochloris thomasi RCC1774]|uniref:Carbonic anhydrase n=1 Tax=Acaryochloris thomasi RCC1774 TaxID=1764569 RepID=A0A2W1JZP2_9CYAN|nr:carbonic anhydrase [Acaryochloris thomasi]PZD73567.1 Carbonic anhydrase 2 [Acaryochloris thomasi RCC1774]